jgi:hypothetical protein
MSTYIVKIEDKRLYLIGPFASQDEAGTWGGSEANNPEDDPRWQTIDLDIPVPKYVTGTMIEIFKPDDEHRPASAGGSGRVSMITG